MKWRRLADDLIESDAGYRIHKDAPDSFCAWGPMGSQDIDSIRENTAADLKKYWGIDRKPWNLNMVAGRGLLGLFVDPNEARAACEFHVKR